MIIIFATFLIPIAMLLARLALILRPKWWAITKAEVLDYGFKTRVYKGKYTAKFLWVRYRYVVNDKEYFSKRVSLDLMNKVYNDSEIEADELVANIKSNKVTALYVENFPSISVMKPAHYKGQDILAVIIFLTIFMLGYAALVEIISK
jgi:hypothetical protein